MHITTHNLYVYISYDRQFSWFAGALKQDRDVALKQDRDVALKEVRDQGFMVLGIAFSLPPSSTGPPSMPQPSPASLPATLFPPPLPSFLLILFLSRIKSGKVHKSKAESNASFQ